LRSITHSGHSRTHSGQSRKLRRAAGYGGDEVFPKHAAEELLFGKLAKGGLVTVKDGKLAFKFQAGAAERPGDGAEPPKKELVFAE
jgi:hypothetical protein